MEIPSDRKYTKDHEWVKVEGGTAVVGITEFAQSELGDIVFVDLPAGGKKVKQHDTLCVVESTKAASDVYSPVAGTVAETNSKLSTAPELVNQQPYGDGWMAKLKDVSQADLATLLDANAYKALLGDK